MADTKNPFSSNQKAKKITAEYFPVIPKTESLMVGLNERLGQQDIRPSAIVDRLMAIGATVVHALNDITVHSGAISDVQHGARGAIVGAHTAADISNTIYGDIVSTNVQASLEDLADAIITGGTNRANRALSNLTGVAINTTLLSDADSTDDLGDTSHYWKDIYVDRIFLSASATLVASQLTDLTDAGDTTLHKHDIYLLLTGGTLTGDIALRTSTGTKIGTATNQLLGFYGATPVDQPATVTDASGTLADATTAINTIIDRLQELGLIA